MIAECPSCKSRWDVTGRPAGTRARCRCGATFPLPEPPTTAGGLSCPHCAAMVPPDASQCAYCRASLAVVACPRCFGLLFQGAKHCQHCGAAIDVPAPVASEGGPTPRGCPACGPASAALVAHLVGDTLLDVCPTCGGMWVNRAAFERLLTERERQAAVRTALAERERPEPVGIAPVVYRRCPDCATIMARQNFGRRSGVVVDVCRPHGIWLDRDELRRVVEFVSSGGLEAAHRQELETLRKQVAEQRRSREFGAQPAGLWDDPADSFLVQIVRLFVP